MAFKHIWSRTSDWLRAKAAPAPFHPDVNPEGLMSGVTDKTPPAETAIQPVQVSEKTQSLERLQDGFNRLITELEGINQHLSRQADRHEALMAHLEKLPPLLETFPAMVENQKHLTEQTLEQLRSAAIRNRQFLEVIEKIPAETARQTDALGNIDNQLSAAAAADAQLAEGFHKFNDTLGKLNQSAAAHTDSILQMNKTFSASDRHLKHLVNVQNRRFLWVFIAAISVCLLAIITLAAIILNLK